MDKRSLELKNTELREKLAKKDHENYELKAVNGHDEEPNSKKMLNAVNSMMQQQKVEMDKLRMENRRLQLNEYRTSLERSDRELKRDIEKWKKIKLDLSQVKLVLPLPGGKTTPTNSKVVRIVKLTKEEKEDQDYLTDVLDNITLSGSDSESDIESDVESDIATDDAIRDISCDLRSSEISIGSSFVLG